MPACSLRKTPVQREDLGNIDNGESQGKTRRAGGKGHCPERLQVYIAGNYGDQDGLNAAAAERVCLDDQYRSPVSRFRAARLGQIRRPDLAPNSTRHSYHESFLIDLSWARCNAGSNLAGRREYTSFRRSVTASLSRRSRNSAIAVA